MSVINYFKTLYFYCRGICLIRSPKFMNAIPFFKKCMTITNSNDFVNYNCNKFIGAAYCYNQQFNLAKDYLFEAEKLILNKSGTLKDADLLGYLGSVYDAEANLERAKEYYQLAIKYYKKGDLIDIDFISSRLIKIDKFQR